MATRLHVPVLVATTVLVAMLMFLPTMVEYAVLLAGISATGVD